jgi:uncharacterized membrane protein YedE/YeeE
MGGLVVFAAGLMFALGLGISGMTDANKVIAFLNPLGGWDPSLAFVMVGAIGAHLTTYRLIVRRSGPLFAPDFSAASTSVIDKRLVIGSAVFGIGWGLGGFCPGPGVVSATGFGSAALAFVGAMVAGMVVVNRMDSRVAPNEEE